LASLDHHNVGGGQEAEQGEDDIDNRESCHPQWSPHPVSEVWSLVIGAVGTLGGGGSCDAGGDVKDVTREHRMHPSSELHQLLVSGMTLSVSLSVAACL